MSNFRKTLNGINELNTDILSLRNQKDSIKIEGNSGSAFQLIRKSSVNKLEYHTLIATDIDLSGLAGSGLLFDNTHKRLDIDLDDYFMGVEHNVDIEEDFVWYYRKIIQPDTSISYQLRKTSPKNLIDSCIIHSESEDTITETDLPLLERNNELIKSTWTDIKNYLQTLNWSFNGTNINFTSTNKVGFVSKGSFRLMDADDNIYLTIRANETTAEGQATTYNRPIFIGGRYHPVIFNTHQPGGTDDTHQHYHMEIKEGEVNIYHEDSGVLKDKKFIEFNTTIDNSLFEVKKTDGTSIFSINGHTGAISNVDTATKLFASKTIGGVAFDGTANIVPESMFGLEKHTLDGEDFLMISAHIIPFSDTTLGLATEPFPAVYGTSFVGDLTGDSNGSHTGNVNGNLTGNVVGNVNGDLTGNSNGIHTGNVVGNATSATTAGHATLADVTDRLFTARTINGVSFNGTADITIPSVAQLTTARNIGGVSFNGSSDIIPNAIIGLDMAGAHNTDIGYLSRHIIMSNEQYGANPLNIDIGCREINAQAAGGPQTRNEIHTLHIHDINISGKISHSSGDPVEHEHKTQHTEGLIIKSDKNIEFENFVQSSGDIGTAGSYVVETDTTTHKKGPKNIFCERIDTNFLDTGPAQTNIIMSCGIEPLTDNNIDLGTTAKKFKDIYLHKLVGGVTHSPYSGDNKAVEIDNHIPSTSNQRSIGAYDMFYKECFAHTLYATQITTIGSGTTVELNANFIPGQGADMGSLAGVDNATVTRVWDKSFQSNLYISNLKALNRTDTEAVIPEIIKLHNLLVPNATNSIDIGQLEDLTTTPTKPLLRFRNIIATTLISKHTTIDAETANATDIRFINLPTTDPTTAGRLWNDSGTLKISAG